MTTTVSLPFTNWNHQYSAADQQDAIGALEKGGVLVFPELRFPIEETETRLLSPALVATSKNISLDLSRGRLRGSSADEAELELLQTMMQRFATCSTTLLHSLFPRYAPGLLTGRTSFRPVEIATRSSSWRKDDTRLHVDSFPSSPVRDKRILRVFSNVNPHGQARTWRLGEPFENVANRFLPGLPGPVWGTSQLLLALGITKGRRSAYDHFMLHIHDRMKLDLDYQSAANQIGYEFCAGSTWIVFTDQVSHAAMSGQYALEQTFHVPMASMLEPERSPLRTLERLLGRTLA